MKAVFNLPERPNPCQAALRASWGSKAHHVSHPQQLATPGAFFHLAVDQALRHLPLASMPSSATSLEPVSNMGRKTQRSRCSSHRW